MVEELDLRSQCPVAQKERVDNGLPINLLNDSIPFEQSIILGVF